MRLLSLLAVLACALLAAALAQVPLLAVPSYESGVAIAAVSEVVAVEEGVVLVLVHRAIDVIPVIVLARPNHDSAGGGRSPVRPSSAR